MTAVSKKGDLAPPSLKDELEVEKLRLEIQSVELDVQKKERELVMHRASNWDRRILDFVGLVTDGSVTRAIQFLSEFAARGGESLTIRLNTPGGLVTAGLAFYDYMKLLRTEGIDITIISMGEAASMGGILLQAATTRLVTPNCAMLIHEISAGDIGKLSEMEEYLHYLKREQDKCLTILAERSTLTKRQIAHRWKKTDWWLSAQEVVDFGFADGITAGAVTPQ